MSSKLLGAASVILDSENRVLLVKHSYGINNWDLPGGKSEEKNLHKKQYRKRGEEEACLNTRKSWMAGISIRLSE
ncbi:NUDIX domain-containing protein [Paenibacillus chibensis]|uniref:NUDIX domain-containing protein n=1 Tax=Paenibacillus chibensis TaxID=59846 RepID=UPI0013E2B2B1